ncbi:hypothetical protein [Candidatus Phytoplasma pyri]
MNIKIESFEIKGIDFLLWIGFLFLGSILTYYFYKKNIINLVTKKLKKLF